MSEQDNYFMALITREKRGADAALSATCLICQLAYLTMYVTGYPVY